MDRDITIEYECEICGQFGNGPYFNRGKALCKFHHWLETEGKRTAKRTEAQYKEFKKMIERFTS